MPAALEHLTWEVLHNPLQHSIHRILMRIGNALFLLGAGAMVVVIKLLRLS